MKRPQLASLSLLGALLLGCALVGCESLKDTLPTRDQALLRPRRNLRRLNLNAADMSKAQLVNADMSESSMVQADFHGNDLSAAYAVGANLERANLSHAELGWATLRNCDLRETNFFRSNLLQVDLRGSDLSGAELSGCGLHNVHLMGTNLSTAKGLQRDLIEQAACWDQRTQWPAGWKLPSPERTCEKHGESEFSRDNAVKSMRVTDEKKLLLRKQG